MTEEQMRERIKEIEKEKDKLRAEQEEYERYFLEKKLEEKLLAHKTYVGKCYISKNSKENKNKHIKAFKILEVLDLPNENYAKCIMLINGSERNCWNSYGTKIEVLDLWNPNISRMIYKESDPKVIDMYKEISHKQFEKLYLDHNFKLDDEVIM